MRRVFGVALALAIGAASLAGAQESMAKDNMGFFKSPVFVLQPGLIKSFADGDGFDFNARFVTALPTKIPRTTIVAIIQWTPFADEDGDNVLENAPVLVYGPVVNVLNTRHFSFDIDGLFAYAFGNCKDTPGQACHQFLVEGDLFVKVGSMMGMGSQWNSLSLYGMLAYVLTEIPSGTPSENRMVLLTGVSLPLAPWKK